MEEAQLWRLLETSRSVSEEIVGWMNDVMGWEGEGTNAEFTGLRSAAFRLSPLLLSPQ